MALDCLTTQEWIAAFLDGELDPLQRDALQVHLDACPACRAELACQRNTLHLLHAWDAPVVSPQLSVRFAECLRERQAPPPFFSRLFGLNHRRLAWGAVATAVLAIAGLMHWQFPRMFGVSERLANFPLHTPQTSITRTNPAAGAHENAIRPTVITGSMLPTSRPMNAGKPQRQPAVPPVSHSPTFPDNKPAETAHSQPGVLSKLSATSPESAAPDATNTVVALLEETPVPSSSNVTAVTVAYTDSRLSLPITTPASATVCDNASSNNANGKFSFASEDMPVITLRYGTPSTVDGCITNEALPANAHGWLSGIYAKPASTEASLEHYVVAALTETY